MKSVWLILLFSTLIHAQEAGTVETFSGRENANSWLVEPVSSDPDPRFPDLLWTLPGSENPELYSTFTSRDGIQFSADALSSAGLLTGDYNAGQVWGLSCFVFLENAASIALVEFFFESGGQLYLNRGFDDLTDGFTLFLSSLREDPWFIIQDGVPVETEITDEILSTVTRVGIIALPFLNEDSPSPVGSNVAIDEFSLCPDPAPVQLTLDPTAGRLTFQPTLGYQYTLERSQTLTPESWTEALEPFASGDPFSFALEPSRPKEFFRVQRESFVLIVPDLDP